MKFKKGDIVIELSDPNTFNIPIREGFVPVTDEVPVEPAQEPQRNLRRNLTTQPNSWQKPKNWAYGMPIA